MNWMHAFFGLGVAIGPLIMTGVLGAGLGWRWGYGIVAAAQLALATAFALSARAWRERTPVGPEAAPAVVDPSADPATSGPAAGVGPSAAGSAAAADGAGPAVEPAAPAAAVGVAVEPAAPVARPVPVRETLRLPAVWLGMLAFAVYVAVEVATGLWAFLLLTEGEGSPRRSPASGSRPTGGASSWGASCRGWWPSGGGRPGCCVPACSAWRPAPR